MKTKINKLIRKRQPKIGGNVVKHRRICGSADRASLGLFVSNHTGGRSPFDTVYRNQIS